MKKLMIAVLLVLGALAVHAAADERSPIHQTVKVLVEDGGNNPIVNVEFRFVGTAVQEIINRVRVRAASNNGAMRVRRYKAATEDDFVPNNNNPVLRVRRATSASSVPNQKIRIRRRAITTFD